MFGIAMVEKLSNFKVNFCYSSNWNKDSCVGIVGKDKKFKR